MQFVNLLTMFLSRDVTHQQMCAELKLPIQSSAAALLSRRDDEEERVSVLTRKSEEYKANRVGQRWRITLLLKRKMVSILKCILSGKYLAYLKVKYMGPCPKSLANVFRPECLYKFKFESPSPHTNCEFLTLVSYIQLLEVGNCTYDTCGKYEDNDSAENSYGDDPSRDPEAEVEALEALDAAQEARCCRGKNNRELSTDHSLYIFVGGELCVKDSKVSPIAAIMHNGAGSALYT